MVFDGPRQPLRPQSFAVPEPTGADVLVRVTACTLCGSDLHTFEGRRPAPAPSVLGHEIVGRIEALGPAPPRRDLAGQELAVGDRITWSLIASCGGCFFCGRGLPQKCERMVKYGHEPLRPGAELTGGLAEYVLLSTGTALLRLPDDLPDEVACPANCATATVAAAVEAAGEMSGRCVLVLGAGMLGLTACALARTAGAAVVVCCDVRPERLERAAAFGATRLANPTDLAATVSQATSGYGVDVALELSGSAEACAAALERTRTGGVVVLVGAVLPTTPLSVAPERLVRGHLTVRGVHNYAPAHLLSAVRFLTAARFPFADLVSEWFPLAEAGRAFERARSSGACRVGVRP
jgi:alcohol dehydrogenase